MGNRSRGSLGVVIALIAALSLALTVVGVPAFGDTTVQDQSPVQAAVTAQSPGKLITKGVAVDVTVEYECLPEVTLNGIFVSLRQRFGRDIAEGFEFVDGSELGPCLGFVSQFVEVRLFAFGTPFKPGKALATTELSGFDQFGFFFVTDDEEIRLRKPAK